MNLFDPLTIKNLTVKNRIVLPPMCMYSVKKKDGYLTDWHVTHYASRAVGGAGLVTIEMTDVDPDGRITDYDSGLWEDGQIDPIKRVVEQCHLVGAKVSIQIAHAGRKAEDAIDPIAPSPIPFNKDWRTPREMTEQDIQKVITQFKNSAKRAVAAGVDAVEIHGAHGYLIHQFQSPYTNKRSDKYGVDLAAFGVEVIQAVKAELPEEMPLILRISAVEYVEDGYGIEHSLALGEKYKAAGIDVFHVSSGGEGDINGIVSSGFDDGYQVPYAKAFKEAFGLPVITVGKLSNPTLANDVLKENKADLVAVGRGMLYDPYWALHAAEALKIKTEIPVQYQRGFKKFSD